MSRTDPQTDDAPRRPQVVVPLRIRIARAEGEGVAYRRQLTLLGPTSASTVDCESDAA